GGSRGQGCHAHRQWPRRADARQDDRQRLAPRFRHRHLRQGRPGGAGRGRAADPSHRAPHGRRHRGISRHCARRRGPVQERAMRARTALLALLMVAVLSLAPPGAHALPPGLVTKSSPYDVTQTLDRLEDLLKKNGFTIVSRTDLRAIAKAGGETIAAAQVLTVSNPPFDAGLLTGQRAIGLELPLRILAYEDTSGHVRLIYADPDLLAQNYNVTSQPVAVQHMVQLLDQLTDEAIKP